MYKTNKNSTRMVNILNIPNQQIYIAILLHTLHLSYKSVHLKQVLCEVKNQHFKSKIIEISHILNKSLLICGLKVLIFENCAKYFSAYLVTTVKRC